MLKVYAEIERNSAYDKKIDGTAAPVAGFDTTV